MKIPFADKVRIPRRMSLGIRPSNAVQIDVTLHTARVISFDIVAGNASFNVSTRPLTVSSTTRTYRTQNPGQDLTGYRSVPNGPEPLFLTFRAVTVDAEVRFVTCLTLLRLPDGIDRMREPIAQIVLSLHGLHDTAAARGC